MNTAKSWDERHGGPPIGEVRSRTMAAIRGRDTKPEVRLRKAMHKLGFRYRVAVARLPGKPDMVLAKHHAVVFVNGCFWHGHDCGRFRMPKTRTDFWRAKIERNKSRDQVVRSTLLKLGWRVFTVWECRLDQGKRDKLKGSVRLLAKAIRGRNRVFEIG